MSADSRGLGVVSLGALVAANMVGAGVFTTSGFAFADLGSRKLVMLAWAVGGLIALCGAISYGALARRLRESGGEYLFLSRTVHPMAGFVAGWVSFLAGFTGAIAFAATAFEAYVRPIVGEGSWLPGNSLAIMVIMVGVLQHALHTHRGAWAQNVLVAIKLLLLGAFIAYGLWAVKQDPTPSVVAADGGSASIFAFAVSVMWISLSYSGFNAAIYVTEEARSPERTVPRAMVAGTVLVALIYLGLNAVFLYSVEGEDLRGAPDVAALAASALGGDGLLLAARLVIAAALYTSVSAMLMVGPRVYEKMAADGVLPEFFLSATNPPAKAVVFQGACAVALVLMTGLQGLLSYLGLTLALSAMVTVACLFVLRRRHGHEEVPVWGYPIVPGVFVISTATFAVLAAIGRPEEMLATVLTVLSGVVLFLIIKPSR